MRISVIVEALVILAIVAFASARVIEAENEKAAPAATNRQEEIIVSDDDFEQEHAAGDDIAANEVESTAEQVIAAPEAPEVPEIVASSTDDGEAPVPVNIDDAHPINRYCTCTSEECNCCREFKLPLVSIRGPGCATVRYIERNKLSVAIKYGDITLGQRTISGRKATPICMPLPGGYSRFCGRVYGITRQKDDFKACLGLELRAQDEVEAALRVSCFNFGPKGLSLSNAEPLPPPADADSDDDDDDDDILSGLVGGDDDDDTGGGVLGLADDDEEGDADDDDDDDDYDDDDAEESGNDDADYSGFSLLSGDIIDGLFGTGGGGGGTRKKKPSAASADANRKKLTIAEPQATKKVPVVAAQQVEKPKKPTRSGATKVVIPNSPGILNSAQITQNEIDSSTANKVDAVEVTTKKNKKDESLLDVVGALVAGDDDTAEEIDDDDDEAEKDDDEEKDDDDEDEDDETEIDADAEEEADEESEEDADEEDDEKKKATTAKAIPNKKTTPSKKKNDFGLGLLGLARFFKLI
ncbi:surface protein-like [Lutzomyia longipalpis]|uniref:surface protein-like n=1 Tax=Lutzomyia longipalpis TaxID=7200 RepID=UPI0024840F4D|nr:surface protein-like [Lutzomyia longipalpis]